LNLRPYQIVGRDFLTARRHALLADEMRLGKTPQAILAAAAIHAQNIIVVCPAIAVPHWQREFPRWYTNLGKAILPRFIAISYDQLRLRSKDWLSQHYDLAIVDEAHFAKNPGAARTRLVYGKGGLGWCSDRLWALSGTPAPKHGGELWPMLRAFNVVQMTYDEFCRYYCRIDYLSQRPVGTKPEKIPELKALLATVMLRRTRKQVAPDMPDISFGTLEINPDRKVDLDVDHVDAAWLEANPHVDSENRIAVALAKVEPLAEEIGFALDNGLLKQTVVFGWHTEPLQTLARNLQARGFKVGIITGQTNGVARDTIQRQFRAGELQVVVANIAAAGTAIDLSAASHGYFLELWWVSGDNLQAANRLISMDKDEPVTFDVCTWPGSVDDRVQQVLTRRMGELKMLY
jgi:SWI/SNF-related matrix-associated actin-dependent regulator 1 of chromatin subfamily A